MTSSKRSTKSTSKGSSKTQKTKSTSTSTWMIVGLVAVALLVVGGIYFFVQGQRQPSSAALPSEISVAQAHDKYNQDTFFLDVREPEEWNEYHIEGATLIPLGELASRVDDLPRDKEIVVVCRSGNRSQAGRDILKDAGFTQVTSMAGGVSQWQASGYPIVTGP